MRKSNQELSEIYAEAEMDGTYGNNGGWKGIANNRG